jgi:hypothetical protein
MRGKFHLLGHMKHHLLMVQQGKDNDYFAIQFNPADNKDNHFDQYSKLMKVLNIHIYLYLNKSMDKYIKYGQNMIH